MEAANDSHGCRFIGNYVENFGIGVTISTNADTYRTDDHIVSGNVFRNFALSGSILFGIGVQINGTCKRVVINGNNFIDFGDIGVFLLGTNVQDVTISNNLFVLRTQNTPASPKGVQINSGTGHLVMGNEFGPGVPGTLEAAAGTAKIDTAVYVLGSGATIEKCIISNNKVNGRNPADTVSGAYAFQFEGQVDNCLINNNILENLSTAAGIQFGTLGTQPNTIKNNYMLSTVPSPYWVGFKSIDLIENISATMVTGQRVQTMLREDFMSGAITANGTGIGELLWTTFAASAGTHAYVNATAGHPGIFQFASSATSGSRNYMHQMVAPGAGNILPADYFDVIFEVKLTQTDTNTVFRCGLGNSAEADPPVDGVYVEKVLADASWFGCNRAASSQNRTAALLTSDTAWNRVRIRRMSATQIGFTINALAEVALTTTIPTTALQPFAMIGTGTTAIKSMQFDFIEINVGNLAR
jgi:hypothetical protein